MIMFAQKSWFFVTLVTPWLLHSSKLLMAPITSCCSKWRISLKVVLLQKAKTSANFLSLAVSLSAYVRNHEALRDLDVALDDVDVQLLDLAQVRVDVPLRLVAREPLVLALVQRELGLEVLAA